MLYLQINYIFHLILNSKYKLIYYFLLYLVFYILIKNNSFADCMTNEFDELNINQQNQELSDIKKEIKGFAGSQAYLLDRIDEQSRIITEQKETIHDLTVKIEGNKPINPGPYYRPKGYLGQIYELQSKNAYLERDKETLTRELDRAQAVIQEYRHTRPL